MGNYITTLKCICLVEPLASKPIQFFYVLCLEVFGLDWIRLHLARKVLKILMNNFTLLRRFVIGPSTTISCDRLWTFTALYSTSCSEKAYELSSLLFIWGIHRGLVTCSESQRWSIFCCIIILSWGKVFLMLHTLQILMPMTLRIFARKSIFLKGFIGLTSYWLSFLSLKEQGLYFLSRVLSPFNEDSTGDIAISIVVWSAQ